MSGRSTCPDCGADFETDSDYCPRCGSLFARGVECVNHPGTPAEGVCVICATPVCGACKSRSNHPILCDDHFIYETYQGMARVYGGTDPVHVEFLRSCLEQEGFHPFVYSRKATPIHIGGPDYTHFMSSGDSMHIIVNEFKLLVPFTEVIAAEAFLKRLDAPSVFQPDQPPG
jgi:hypothetical protein